MDDFKVLMYHEIVSKEEYSPERYEGIYVRQDYSDKLPPPLFCYLEEFERQMEYLYINNYRTLTLKDIKDFYYKGKPLPEKSILLTFDDLYKSVIINAYPILKKYNFHAVGFVVRDWIFDEKVENIKDKSVCMSFEELDLIGDVFEFANHTSSLHTRNGRDTALVMVDEDKLREDILRCEEAVSTKNVLAYPFGIYNENVLNILDNLGFSLSFTTEGGTNTRLTDPLRLHRNGVFVNYSIEDFRNIINNSMEA